MLVVMKAQASPEEIQAVCEHIEALGFRAHPMPGAQRTAVGITGNRGEVDRGNLEEMSGVAEVIRVSKPYKLVSRDVKEEDTVIRFGGTNAMIGGAQVAMIAGPCSIESREQAFAIAEQVALSGAQFFRGGAYKPRTSPYSFQGMEGDGLKLLEAAGHKVGLPIVTEIMDPHDIDLFVEHQPTQEYGHDRIDVRIGGNARNGGVSECPRIRGIADNASHHDQVPQAKQGRGAEMLGLDERRFADQPADQQQPCAANEHLRPGRRERIAGQVEPPREVGTR